VDQHSENFQFLIQIKKIADESKWSIKKTKSDFEKLQNEIFESYNQELYFIPDEEEFQDAHT